MKAREPWIGLAGIAGLVLMLLGDGPIDLLGFVIATGPLAFGLGAALIRRRHP